MNGTSPAILRAWQRRVVDTDETLRTAQLRLADARGTAVSATTKSRIDAALDAVARALDANMQEMPQ